MRKADFSSAPEGKTAGNGMDFTGFDMASMASLMRRQKRNFEAMVALNRTIATSAQAIAAEQCAMLRDCVTGATDAVKQSAEADSALTVVQQQAQFARKAIATAVQHTGECAEIAARSTRDVARVLGDRAASNLAEIAEPPRTRH